jgi:Protein of unknown function (DUF2878)
MVDQTSRVTYHPNFYIESIPLNTPPLRAQWANLIRWVATVLAVFLTSAHGRADLGAFIGFLMLAMHFRTSDHLLADYKTVASTLMLGALWEFELINHDIIRYQGESSWSPVPAWLLIFWAMFGTTLNGAFGWFRNHPLMALIFGLITGPFLWELGRLAGAIEITKSPDAYLIIASGWAILLPPLFMLARYFTNTSEHIERH